MSTEQSSIKCSNCLSDLELSVEGSDASSVSFLCKDCSITYNSMMETELKDVTVDLYRNNKHLNPFAEAIDASSDLIEAIKEGSDDELATQLVEIKSVLMALETRLYDDRVIEAKRGKIAGLRNKLNSE